MVMRSFQAAEADLRESAVTSEYQSCADQLPPLEIKPQFFLCFSVFVGTEAPVLGGKTLMAPDPGPCKRRSGYRAAPA